MAQTPTQPGLACCYFVDEAGDGTLFDRKGRVIIGDEGCSHDMERITQEKSRLCWRL